MRLIARLPFSALVAAGLVIAGIALVPGTAAASCGSYVTIQPHDDSGRAAPTRPAAPCHGPGCSKAPVQPALPLTAPVHSGTDSDHLSAVTDECPVGAPPRRWAFSRTAHDLPVRPPVPIFHPPRAA